MLVLLDNKMIYYLLSNASQHVGCINFLTSVVWIRFTRGRLGAWWIKQVLHLTINNNLYSYLIKLII